MTNEMEASDAALPYPPFDPEFMYNFSYQTAEQDSDY
jgi:hypothetical protein